MDEERNRNVINTLRSMEVHRSWESAYRTSENNIFYGICFDYISSVYGSLDDEAVLDAGCGSGAKTQLLAERGYRVVAVDISRKVLDEARQNIERNGYRGRATFQLENITDMSFSDSSFSRVLSWGVLMHVPNVEKAISELARVTRRGGTIVISEANVSSLQAKTFRSLKTLLQRKRTEMHRTAAGIEFWEETPSGQLVTRQTDMGWIIRAFETCGVGLIRRRAGQFSEIYTLLPWRMMRRIVHTFNNYWFRHITYPGLAFGNLLVFRKYI